MITVRCSALPMLIACGRSLDETALAIDSASAPANLGTAAHDAMVSITSGLRVDVPLLALRHGVSADELGPLVWYGRKAWEELAASFPCPSHEVEVEYRAGTFRITGHVDILSTLDRHARIADWKTGRKEETDYYAQLAGYAVCLILGSGYESVTASVVWLRSQTIETYEFTRSDALNFVAQIRRLIEIGGYRTGEHCAYCPRSHDCEALVAIGKRDLAIFGDSSADALALEVHNAPPEVLVQLRRRAKMLESFAGSLDAAIRRRISLSGPLDSGDGYALSLVEENGKREIDTAKAWPILQDRLTDDELAGCVTVSARAADEAVAKKAGRGNGAEAKRQLAAALEAAEAVSQKTVTKLREVRLPKLLSPNKEEEATNGK